MLVVVIERVVDPAALALAAVAEVDRGEAQVLQEGRIVRAGAKGRDRQVLCGIGGDLAGGLGLFAGPGFGRRHLQPGAGALANRDAGLRILHVGRHLVHEMLEVVAALGAEEAAAVAVGIDVDESLGLQLVAVRLGPLGGAKEHRLFAVPARVDDRPLRLPAGLDETTERLGLGQQGDLAAQGVGGPHHPAVVVVAAHDPVVRRLAALQGADHVVEGLLRPVRLHRQVDLTAAVAAADVIGDRQRATEVGRRHRTVERRQQHLGVRIGDRQAGNL